MKTELNAVYAKRIKALNISAKTEEVASLKLLKILSKNGIDGMEEEDLDTLLDIAESFVDDINKDNEELLEIDELADEIEFEEIKESIKKEQETAIKKQEEIKREQEVAEEEQAGEEKEELDVEEKEELAREEKAGEEERESDCLDKMDRKELKNYIKEKFLTVQIKKTDDEIREEIRKELKSLKDDTDPEKAKGRRGKSNKAHNIRLAPKSNEDDRKYFDELKNLFPETQYSYDWIVNAGVTVKLKGKNSQRSIFTIKDCYKLIDGSIRCNLYLLTFIKDTEALEEAGIDYLICWSGAPFVKKIPFAEALEIVKDFTEQMIGSVKKIDKRLGENRKKMEEKLEKKTPKKK